MRETSYTDDDGRQWAVQIPDDAPDSDAPMGIPLGPPSLEPLGLQELDPKEFEVRLHNQLCARRLFTLRDVKARRTDIQGALQAALKVDVVAIAHLYRVEEPPAVPSKPTKEIPKQRRRKRR